MTSRFPVLSALALAALTSTVSAQVVLNEVCYDAAGTDDGLVFIELYGPAGTDISGWTVQAINGTPTSSCLETIVLPAGTMIPADGCYVIADGIGTTGTTSVPNADLIIDDADLQNGPDAIQLLDAGGALVDAVAYGAVDTTNGPLSGCNGLAYYEGNFARDVFGPLSIERIPAGTDTNDNATDFTPNYPTPGVAASCPAAIERVGPGALSISNGDSAGMDFWLGSCGANKPYLVLIALTDPALSTPPLGLPVFDGSTPLWLDASLAGGPFLGFSGVLDATGSSVGQVSLDWSQISLSLGMSFDIWLGAAAYDMTNPLGNPIYGTNSIQLTINP